MTSIQIRGLGLHLGKARILADIDLDVQAGARHVITGHNGAGKSSLLRILTGTIRATHGSIRLGGNDITGWAPHRRARAGVAHLWQHPAVWADLTVAENFRLAVRKGPRRERAEQLLHDSGLHGRANDPASSLSFGMRRSLELTIALAGNPSLLILDEPTAGMSPQARHAIAAALDSLDSGLTVIITDHDHALLGGIATHRTELVDGRVVRTGPAWWDPAAAPAPCLAGPDAHVATALSVQGLAVARAGTAVLSDVSFTLGTGTITAVTGPNGAGKTTLLAALAGLAESQAGAVSLAGRPIETLAPDARRRAGLATMLQDHLVFGGLTVADHLSLHRCNVDLFDSLAGRGRQAAESLSGGQQKLLAVAMALAGDPAVVLLDEPFEGLAAPAAAQLAEVLADRAANGMAILLTGHHLTKFAGLPARIVRLADL